MAIQSDTPPLCACCGGKIRKNTRCVMLGQRENKPGNWMRDLQATASNKEDCQRLTNGVVTKVTYSAPGLVRCFFEWDGLSYAAVGDAFCSGPCAELFAMAAHRLGFRLPRYIAKD